MAKGLSKERIYPIYGIARHMDIGTYKRLFEKAYEHEYACHHKVSVLEDDQCKPEGGLCLPEFRGSVCS